MQRVTVVSSEEGLHVARLALALPCSMIHAPHITCGLCQAPTDDYNNAPLFATERIAIARRVMEGAAH